MAHRRLTEGCIHAMRAAAAQPAIFNRTIADNLRIVAKVHPQFLNITTDARRSHAPGLEASPLIRATLTPQGLAFITPRKLRQQEARP